MKSSYNHPGGKLRRQGAWTCSEKELLAIIINSGTKNFDSVQIAEKLLDKFGGLNNMMGHTLHELIEIEGIGITKATQIAALFELTKRILRNLENE
ncbi:MAG: radC [Ignavibacteria bacterium]|nr:radC [Ignavibacteria bacterium]